MLGRLLQTVRLAVVRLEFDAVRRQDDRAVDTWHAVRACERELALVAEAAGLDARARGVHAGHGRTALDVLVESYAVALVAELPRAVRGVLETHLARLRTLAARDLAAA